MWNQLLVILIGVWLTVSPDVMGYVGPERLTNHVTGVLVVGVAMMALWEQTRSVLRLNVALGMWLLVAPVALGYQPLHIGVRSSAIGLAIIGLSWIEGTRRERLGGGWSSLWSKPTGGKP